MDRYLKSVSSKTCPNCEAKLPRDVGTWIVVNINKGRKRGIAVVCSRECEEQLLEAVSQETINGSGKDA